MCSIYTVGYEGKTIDEFIEMLQANKILQIIDVREFPISRKRGFSKTALHQRLKAAGIKYIHYRTLGSPRPIRERLHDTQDYDFFFAEYRAYAAQNLDSIHDAYKHMVECRSCLLCFERDYRQCHRCILADMMLNEMPNVDEVVNL